MASEIAKKNIVFALCKYLSLDTNVFSSDLGSNVKSLYTRMLSSSGKWGCGLKPSEADIMVFSVVHATVVLSDLSSSDKAKLPHLLRWVDYIQLLVAPEEANIGECVTFSGHDGRPEDVLNPKKKQLDKITTHLFTDDKGVATFKNNPFTTSAGPCTSSIPNAYIK